MGTGTCPCPLPHEGQTWVILSTATKALPSRLVPPLGWARRSLAHGAVRLLQPRVSCLWGPHMEDLVGLWLCGQRLGWAGQRPWDAIPSKQVCTCCPWRSGDVGVIHSDIWDQLAKSWKGEKGRNRWGCSGAPGKWLRLPSL